MTDILLIQPPIQDFYLTRKRTIPYGLAAIAAVLQQSGFSVTLWDALATSKSRTIELPAEMIYLAPFYPPDSTAFALFQSFKHFGYSYQHIENIIHNIQPKIVGISALFTAYSNEALRVAEIAKAVVPRSIVVVGGHHPTALPEAVIDHPSIDFVIRGEGEAAMPQLARAIIKGEGVLEEIPGIVYRTADKRFINKPPATMDALDRYPTPSLRDIKTSYYQRRKRGAATIVTSRGCPFHCSYCCVGATAGRFRQRTVASVLDEIVTAVEQHNVGFIDFEDEHLSLNKAWLMELLAELATRLEGRAVELRAMNGLFPPSLDEDILRAMRKAGFRTLNLALGTTSNALLKRFRRSKVQSAANRVLTQSQCLGLKSVCYLIAGVPDQTARDTLADLLYLAYKPALIGLSIFYPAPGSQDYQTCSDRGLLPTHYPLMRSSALPIDDTTTRLEALTLLRLTRILNFMKSLVDANQSLPRPKPFDRHYYARLSTNGARMVHLLEGFLFDGKIRGTDPNGNVFEHVAAIPLCRQFVSELNVDLIQGTG